jgi:hypothetical protein
MKNEKVLELIAEGQEKERPILFSTPMVKAILEGRKCQTRRIVKGTPLEWLMPDMFTPEFVASPENNLCPYGKVGDILWVRETWVKNEGQLPTDLGYVYKAELGEEELKYSKELGVKWKPSIFMPRDACRIKLRIESIRIERLQDITEEDCICEGVEHDKFLDLTAKENFRSLWDSINGNWDSNPFVWVISFCRAVGAINSKTSH